MAKTLPHKENYSGQVYEHRNGYSLVDGWNYDFAGTGLMGYINSTYKELVEHFGLPVNVDGERIGLRWHIKFDDGQVATIFNYKGEDGYNVGGFKQDIVERVEGILNDS